MEHKVSIILPTYNGAKNIQKAIQSVVDQTFIDWCLFVVDDGSTDNTQNIVSSFALNDKRIFYVKNDKNLGIQKSLNRGVSLSFSQYIARIDDDDEWIDKEKLQKQVDFLDSNTDHVLVGTSVLVKVENSLMEYKKLAICEDLNIRKNILFKNPFVHSSVLFRRDVFSGYDEDETKKHVEDYDLWLKMGLVGKFANIKDVCVLFLERKDSISGKKKYEQLKKDLFLIKDYKNKYPNFKKALVCRKLLPFIFLIFKIMPEPIKKYFILLYKLS